MGALSRWLTANTVDLFVLSAIALMAIGAAQHDVGAGAMLGGVFLFFIGYGGSRRR